MNGTHAGTPITINGDDRGTAVSYDVVIVGAGPAGASLACFLASHGVKGILISKSSSVANTPRAHMMNPAALECLRAIGLESECVALASKGECLQNLRFCHSMAGREYARVRSWGHDPKLGGAYEAASPCRHVDLPQPLLEPILIRYATLNGFQCRYDTEFISLRQDEDAVMTTVLDTVSSQVYHLQSKYLFGADGGRSKVAEQLGLPFEEHADQGVAVNVHVKADLSHLMNARMGNLHWILQPDMEFPSFAFLGTVRMVRPWTEWVFGMVQSPTAPKDRRPSQEEYMMRVKEFIGDDTPAEIIGISRWQIQEKYARALSKGRVFCLGDAVHRHPPFNALGSNTGIEDAFNLAWKVAFVLKGVAGPSLLDTFSSERQPVAKAIVGRANETFRDGLNVLSTFGLLAPTMQQRMTIFGELNADSEAGVMRRRRFGEAVTWMAHGVHALGIEMNQHYRSAAIREDDEEVVEDIARMTNDPILHYMPSTYPGRRLPHAWLSSAVPAGLISTIDLAGRGCFTLFTGIGGVRWRTAAAAASRNLKIPILVYTIGFGEDYEDVYFDWARLRGVQESGCVLVRPDRFVAWRAMVMADHHDGLAQQRLLEVIRSVLCLS